MYLPAQEKYVWCDLRRRVNRIDSFRKEDIDEQESDGSGNAFETK
ncbi:hypothetical protein [Agriterribacter sp.]|nr:hypothetical protein [Agriterribacter sp.]